MEDIVLGFDEALPYADGRSPYFGALVGRCANRIAKGRFTLDGKTYQLAQNNDGNALHGGVNGFSRRIWNAERLESVDGQAVRFTRTSADGEEGYPGNLKVSVTYTLTEHGVLKVVMDADTDQPTLVNLAQHSYFNLGGHDSGDVLDHLLTINGDHYTPVVDAIPTGEILQLRGTPFDFSEAMTVGSRIADVPGGYDHNYVLHNMGRQAKFATKCGSVSDLPKYAATLHDPKSGRVMKVLTTAPGMQFYSGNFLGGGASGKGGVAYPKHGGLCLETQAFPDSINQPSFPAVVIRPGEQYHHEVQYHFSTR
ncbi:hypothetical protein WJX72_004250 [[Myrmecia] bisecta]|uniref:Aldose 1-epimerase n=1 Tax=[Myrmecia] bisecta TaxID=41462 RepID=A0AAW1Q8N7_9CHLO